MAKYNELFSNPVLSSLENGFHSALDVAAKDGSLDPLIHYLSSLFDCDRVYIFQKNRSGNYDMTYEWCASGIPHHQHLLQNLHWEACSPYYSRFQNEQLIKFDDVDQLLSSDPELYHILKPQDVKSLIAGQLDFFGQDLGFIGIDNIHPRQLHHAAGYVSTLRYFISAVLVQQRQDSRLLGGAADDSLLGIGTWHGLFDAMDRMNRRTSIGIIYINLLTLKDINIRRGRQFGDNLLVEIGRQLLSIFNIHNIYRIHGDDFVVVYDNTSHRWFQERSDMLRKKLLMTGIALEYGFYWTDCWDSNSYAMLAKAKSRMRDLSYITEDPNAPSMASHLTIDLYHAEEFTTRADTWLRMLPEEKRRIAVFAIDYDNFMLYNSIFGRAASDALLKTLSTSLLAEAHAYHGITGYMGGDNFILILPVQDMTRDEIATTLLKHLQKHTRHIGFSPSCGVFLCEQYTNESAALLYDHALTALSQIKDSFTEHIAFFNPEIFDQIRQTQILMMDIDTALKEHEFTFYLQPKVDLESGQMVSAEALVRWKKDGAVLLPKHFIPQIEKNGYIFAVDCYVWEAVCRYLRKLLDQGITPCPISVNISRVDFYFDDLASHLIRLTERYQIEPRYLELEITESAYATEQGLISDFITRMQQNGFRVLIDDFGSGYSSLSVLQSFHANALKIDKQFIDPLKEDEPKLDIIASVITMAKALDIRVVAEGVETERERELLLKMHCPYAQGYLFYRPMTKKEFRHLLQEKSSDEA